MENNCSICISELSCMSNIRLKCSHVFHKNCIIEWIHTFTDSKPSCPICRSCLCYISPSSIEYANFNSLKLTEITFLYADIFKYLQNIDISDNLITDINLSQFSSLTELDIRKNCLKQLQLPQSIKTLYIDAVDINLLINGEPLCDLTDLTISNLNHENMLRGIDTIKEIKVLEIINNSATNLNILSKLKKLEELTIKNTISFDISFVSSLPNIKILEIDTSDFDDIVIERDTNIQSLSIIGSKINNINFLDYFPKLTKLNLNNNLLSEFKKINPNLKYLNLENNFITDTDFLRTLTKIEYLNIGNNLITNVDSIRLLLNLEIFKCHGNILTDTSIKNIKEHVNFDIDWL